MSNRTATLEKGEYFHPFRRTAHVTWTLWLSDGNRKICRTKREAVEWAAELNVTIVPMSAARRNSERLRRES